MNEKKNHHIIEPMQGNPLKQGVTVKHGGVNFTMVIPDGKKASLLLYDKGQQAEPYTVQLEEKERIGDVSALLFPDKKIAAYTYAYEIAGKHCLDPYAKCIVNDRCRIVTEKYDWKEDRMPEIPYHESIFYKLHVKGFTKQSASRVRAKGTFAGLTEKIPYLKSLGVTTILCMPIYEWNETLKSPALSMTAEYREQGTMVKNFWGYAEENYYFAPKASYSYGKDPVRECKDMIRSLHEAGMECVMEFYFPKDTNTIMAMDALRYWRMEYHIDGFRLMGEGAPVDAIVQDPLLKCTKLLLDHVDGEWIYHGKNPFYRNLAEYNDGFTQDGRRFLKGDDGQQAPFAYRIRRNPSTNAVLNYMADNNGFTMMDMVSYDRKHNEANGEDNVDGNNQNYNWNCGAEGPTRKYKVRQLRKKQLKNAFLYVLLAQGTPMILAGDEFGNSQGGNNNTYCQDNPNGWVDWSAMKKNEELLSFVKQAIAFRREHAVLHLQQELRIMDYKSLGIPDLSYHDEHAWHINFENSSRYLGVMYYGAYAKLEQEEEDNSIYVAYNAYWEPHTFALPKTKKEMHWYTAIDTSASAGSEITRSGEEKQKEIQKTVQVPPRTVVVLITK